MILEISLGIALLVIIAAVVLWPAISAWSKRLKGTKGAQAAIVDVDKVEAMIEQMLKHANPVPAASAAATASSSVGTQSRPAVSPGADTATPATASEPVAASSAGGGTDPAAAHAALDATIATHQAIVDNAKAAKDALTDAQSALANAAAAASAAAKPAGT